MSVHFEFVKEINSELYQLCIKAERRVKTKPSEVAIHIRKCVEYFVTWLCDHHMIENPKGVAPTTANMIELAFKKEIITQKDRGLLHSIKSFGNGEAHIQYKSESGEVKKRTTVDAAFKHVKYFFYVLERYAIKYNHPLPDSTFDLHSLPIYDVTPTKTIETHQSEACENKWYGIYVNPQTKMPFTCIIREFRKENFDKEEHFKIRDMMALSRIWMVNQDTSNIVNYHNIEVEEDNELFYTCYFVNEKTETLQHLNVLELNNRERLELLLDVANGIKQLHSSEDPIFHRFLRPESIFIYKNNKGKYIAKIGNFEFAKLYDPSGATVVSRVLSVDDLFSAPDIKTSKSAQLDWHTYDLYSFGVLILYVFAAPSLKVPIAQIKQLKKAGLSDNIQQITKNLINPNPQKRPSIQEVIDTLRKEQLLHV